MDSKYYDRRADAMLAIHEHVVTDPRELQEDLEAFREDLELFEQNNLPHLAAWAREVIARLEAKLAWQP